MINYGRWPIQLFDIINFLLIKFIVYLVDNGVKAGIGILVTVLIGLILVIVVMGVCLCRSKRQQMNEKKISVV